MSLQAASPQPGEHQKYPVATDEETFYLQSRAAYLAVFRSSLTHITSKQQLCRVLQQAGRNPSQAALNKYWTPRTSKLNFDDFCEILKHEKPTQENELMRAFRKMDVNGDGFISHSELERVLTSRGERMSAEEVNAIFSLADTNKDGKLDYAEFCRLLTSATERCQTAALERLQADAKLRRQNFGNQSESSPKASGSTDQSESPSKASASTDQSESPAKASGSTAAATTVSQPPEPARTESDATPKKDSRSSSRPSSARSRRSSLSNSITMAASNTKTTRVPEPTALQEWHHSSMKGSFFLEDDGSISSLQYRLHLPQSTTVYLTIQPLNLSQRPDKPSSWMNVDTALFVVSAGETKEESSLVCYTESRDKEGCVWKGELGAGSYFLLPFTSGCRLRRRNRKSGASKPAQLVYRTDTGELDLTREFREALSDIFEVIDLDGNGLLSLEEYNLFELRTSGEKCDEEAWSVCKENFDTRRNQLTRQGFMELNLMEATERDGDPTDLWLTLEAMGFNRCLEMVEACPFQIDVHCEGVQPSVQPVCLDSGSRLLNQALLKTISARSEARTLRGQDNVLIYTYRGEHRISSLIANKTNQKVTVHVNNEQSKNCISSRGMSVFAVEVPARTKMGCVWKGELGTGSYFLLPFTSGCRLRRRNRKSGASKPAQLVYRTDTGELDLTREFREALSDIFEVIDLDGNGLLSLEEYNLFEMRTSGEKCDEEAWSVCKENFDTRRNQLTRQGFMELNLMEATERDEDPTDRWLTLEAMGFNRCLEMVEACPFQIDVHCEGVQPSVQPVSLDSGSRLLNQALLKTISARSEARTLRGQDNVLIYTYRGEHRISSLIANKTNQKVTVHVNNEQSKNCISSRGMSVFAVEVPARTKMTNQKVTVHVNNEQSKNCISSRGMSVFAVEVPARTKMVCQHVLPINDRQDWTYSCVESILPCP